MPRRLRSLATAILLLAALQPAVAASAAGGSLRFHGYGAGDVDRVKIPIDDPATSDPGPPADVGATDFTIELWLRAEPGSNSTAPVSCGNDINWIYGNIVLDRDRFNQDRKFGFSLAAGRAVFGVSGDGTGSRTVCGSSDVRDGVWHHVALQRRRSDGRMWLYVDGALEGEADGPNGDVSYPDDGVPGDYCGGPCTWSDPYLVVGAEKHDAGASYPSFDGWVDELRLSTTLRYDGAFSPPLEPFSPDGDTAALYHFDEGSGDVVGDASGGGSNGERRFGGAPTPGPEWAVETPFEAAPVRCGGRLATMVGTAGDDVLTGGPGVDVIAGRGGRDVIRGKGGNDVLCGNGGADTIIGGGGDDLIDGGPGKDWVSFAAAPDGIAVSLRSGIASGWGDDTLHRVENVMGSARADILRGSGERNVIDGGGGRDLLVGYAGNDKLLGRRGDDKLRGGRGDDVLNGGGGTNRLNGGSGSDDCRNGIPTDCE